MAVITKISHVQNDLRPKKTLTLLDENDQAVDLTALNPDSIRMHIRNLDTGAFKATVQCTQLAGLVLADGTVSTTAPYNVVGKGGRIQIEWTADAVDTAGQFEGEVELLFGSDTQTTYRTIPITIREQIA